MINIQAEILEVFNYHKANITILGAYRRDVKRNLLIPRGVPVLRRRLRKGRNGKSHHQNHSQTQANQPLL